MRSVGKYVQRVLLMAAFLGLVGCAPMAVRIQKAIDRGDYAEAHQSAERWLKQLPREKRKSYEAKRVRRLSAEAYMEEVKEEGTPAGFRRFQRWAKKRRGTKDLRRRARRLEAQTYYKRITLASPTPEKFQDFRRRYPKARQIPNSKRREADVALEQVSENESLDGYREFRARYKVWDEARLAIHKAREQELEYAAKQVLRRPRFKALQEFRSYYDGWVVAPEAFSRVRQAEVDLVVKSLRRRPTLAELKQFRQDYGSWEEAEKHLPKIRAKELTLAYKQAVKRRNAEAMVAFRNEYESWPQAEPFIAKARKQEVKLAFAAAMRSKELAPLIAFRSDYADWPEAQATLGKARLREVSRAFRLASGSIDKLKAFRSSYGGDAWPEAKKLVAKAYEEEASQALRDAVDSGEQEMLDDFRQNYPEEKWQRLLEISIASKVLTPILMPLHRAELPDDDTILEFLKNGIDHPRVKEAAKPQLNRIWRLAQKAKRPLVYRLYHHLDESSARAKKAKRKERDLYWADTVSMNVWQAYEQFARTFPEDDRALIAEGRAIALQRVAGAQTRWPRATVTHTRRLPNGDQRLFVDVKDCEGNLVSGLRRSVFEAYHGLSEAKIVDFRGLEDERPLKLLFAIDLSGSMDTERMAVHQAVVDMAETMRFRGRQTGLSLIAFGDEIVAKKDHPTEDTRVFRQWMDQLPINSGGANEDSVQALVEGSWALDDQRGERVMMLITDEPLQVNLNGIRNLRFNTHPGFVDASSEVMNRVTKVIKNTNVRLFVMASDLSHHGLHSLASQVNGEVVRVPQDSRDPEDYRRALMYIADKLSKQYVVHIRPTRKQRGKGLIPTLFVRNMHLWRSVAALPGKQVVSMISMGGQPNCPAFSLVTAKNGVFASSKCGATWQPIAGTETLSIVAATSHAEQLAVIEKSGAVWRSGTFGADVEQLDLGKVKALQAAYDAKGSLWLVVRSKKAGFKVLRWHDGTTESLDLKLNGRQVPVVMPELDGEGRICVLTGSNSMRCGDAGEPGASWSKQRVRGLPGAELRTAAGFSLMKQPRSIAFLTMGKGSVYRSIDHGKRWNRVVKADGSRRHLVFIEGDRPVICASGTKRASCSEDFGRRFHTVGRPFMDSGLGGLTAFEQDLYLAQGGSLQRLARVVSRDIPSSAVYFETRSTQFSAAMVPFLDALVALLRADPALQLRVEGHADARGSNSLNEKLAAGRAQSTTEYIVTQGIDHSRVETVSFGERMPIRKGTSSAALSRNRRVELTLFKPIPREGWTFDECGRRQERNE